MKLKACEEKWSFPILRYCPEIFLGGGETEENHANMMICGVS